MIDMQSLFTERKVARTLAALLPEGMFEGVHWDRWSVTDDRAGVATQVRTTTKLLPNDPDVAAYTAIPEDAFDSARRGQATDHRLTWIRMSDIHPHASSDEFVACVWAGEKTLFFRVTSSAAARQIFMYDGPDLNAFTTLVLAVLRHYDSLRWTRWAADLTRAARDNVNWSLMHRTCEDRGLLMRFGTSTYHPTHDRAALAILGVFGKEKDHERRQQLTGTSVQKAKDGGVTCSERQMPHGYRHRRIPGTNRRIKDATKGYLPEAMWDFAPVLQQIVEAAVSSDADGRYTPWREITRLLAVSDVPRRGQAVDGTYRGIFGDVDFRDPLAVATAGCLDVEALYRTGRSFLINTSFKPRQPAERAADPELTLEERLYLNKILLYKTGIYFQIRTNDIRGRDADAKGERPVFRGPNDEYGYYPLEASWGFPVNPETGEELIGWGIPDEIWDNLIQRLLSETRPRRPRGGRAHDTAIRRIVEDFGIWTTDSDDPKDPFEWTIGARVNNSRHSRPGRQNFVVLRRPWSEGSKPGGGRRGWSIQQTNPLRYVHATANLAELAGDLSCQLDTQVRAKLLDQAIAPVTLPARRATRDAEADRLAIVRAKLDTITAERDKQQSNADSLRKAAAAFLTEGRHDKFKAYDQLADDADTAAAVHEKSCSQLLAELTTTTSHTEAVEGISVNISVAAYLTEALRRAALNNGEASWRAATVAGSTLQDWRFTPRADLLEYSCVARLPLAAGGTADLSLAGTITNIRTKSGKAGVLPDTIAHAVFAQARDIDELATLHDTSRRAIIVKRLMPWLAGQGITDRAIKCALIDHPVPAVKRLVFAALTDQPQPGHARWSAGWRQLVADTYITNPPQWGFAACPDDTTVIHQVAATLALPQHQVQGLPVAVIAAHTGLDAKTDVRRWVLPEDRAAYGLGFKRPAFFEYTPGSDKQRIRLVPCPHRGCRGLAARVLLLPEVAVSGWGVLCTSCWRAPVGVDAMAAPEARLKQARWAKAPFPPAYDTYVSGRSGPAGSLRLRGETRISSDPQTFDINQR